MKPLVERLAKQYSGKIEFRRLNVETDPDGIELANRLGVQYVPTFAFVNTDGTIESIIVGGVTEQQLKTVLDRLR